MSYILWPNTEWKDIDKQDWPTEFGTLFLTKAMNNMPGLKVHEWVDDPSENVKTLAHFYDYSDAILFLEAKRPTPPTEKGGEGCK